MIEIVRIAGPLTVWLASFSGLYGLHGLVCSERWAALGLDAAAGRMSLLLSGLAACALQVAFLVLLRRASRATPSATLHFIGVALGVVALVATVWTLVPVLATPVCA